MTSTASSVTGWDVTRALTDGIQQVDVIPSLTKPHHWMRADQRDGFARLLKVGRDLFWDRGEAVAKAEHMRELRVGTLERQLAKARAATFGGAA